jgi:hypothetical protein
VTENDERFDHWVPAPGQIVRVKPGFKGSIEERAFRRASEEGGPKLKLDEKTLYEVVKYDQEKNHRALHLQEVNIIYVAGERFVIKRNKVHYPLSIEFLQLAHEHNTTGKPPGFDSENAVAARMHICPLTATGVRRVGSALGGVGDHA